MEHRHAGQIAALTAVHILATAALALVMASAPTLRRDFEISQTEYGLLVSAFYVGQIGLAIPSGRLVDRIGVRRGLALAVLTSIAAVAGLASVTSAFGAGLLMFALGVAAAFVNPATAKGVFDWVPMNRRAFAMSVKQMGVPLGAVLAAIAAYFAAGYGRGYVFGALAACLSVGTFVLLVLPRDAPGSRRSPPIRLRELLRNRSLLTISACNGLFNVAQVGLWVSVAAYGAVLGGGPEAGALFFAVLHAGSAVGRVTLGIAANRAGPQHLWQLVLVVGSLGSAGLVALAVVSDIAIAIVLLALLGLTIGSYPGILQTMALTAVAHQSTAAAIGINMTLVLAGAMVAPILIGVTVDVSDSFRTGFVLLAVVAAAGCALLFRWHRSAT